MKQTQPNQPSQRAALLILFILTALVGFISWKIARSKQSFLIDITDVAFLGGGQLCPIPLYDAQGNSYAGMVWGNIDFLAYVGPAPLYSVDSSSYPDESNGEPCWYPEKISPDIAVNGIKIYPLLLTVNSTKDMTKGESTKLSTDAQLLDQYPDALQKDSVLFAVVVEPTSILNVNFSLNSTNIEFAPPNEPVHTFALSFSQPAHQDWIISPDDDALGNQYISVRLDDYDAKDYLASADIAIYVKDISGLNPTVAALLGASGTFLLGFFGILKIIPETWSLYKTKQQPKKKSKSGK